MLKLDTPRNMTKLPNLSRSTDAWSDFVPQVTKIASLSPPKGESAFYSAPVSSLHSITTWGGQDIVVSNILSHEDYTFRATMVTSLNEPNPPISMSMPPLPERNVQGIAGRSVLAFLDREKETLNFFLGNIALNTARWVTLKFDGEMQGLSSFSSLYVLGVDEVYGRVYVRHHNSVRMPHLYIIQY